MTKKSNKTPNFIQIHALTPLNGVLANRDDDGMSKGISIGNIRRTRISSQCLKRHYRKHNGVFALNKIAKDSESFRTRLTIRDQIMPAIKGEYSEKAMNETLKIFHGLLHGNKKVTGQTQMILLGVQEVRYLAKEAETVAKLFDDLFATFKVAGKDEKLTAAEKKKQSDALNELTKEIKGDLKANLKALREQNELAAGIAAALFGRMMTADDEANIEAPIHVAHAFTVHREESESDFFSVVDDLMQAGVTWEETSEDKNNEAGNGSGAGHLNETEITSNLFYKYINVDTDNLLRNVNGNRVLAGKILHNLAYLVTEVMPNAKAGSTAPYSRASFMMVTAGDRQPLSLSEAFREGTEPRLESALEALEDYVNRIDQAYGMDDKRKYMSISNRGVEVGAERASVPELASWMEELMTEDAD